MKLKNVMLTIILLSSVSLSAATFEEGIKAYNEKQDGKAKKIFKSVLREDNDHHLARFNLASIYLFEKKYQLALKHYSKVAKSDSKLKYPAQYYMAEAYFYLNKDKKAVAILISLKNRKLTKTLKRNVNELLIDLKPQDAKTKSTYKEEKYSIWGGAELALGFSDNYNLESELSITKAGGIETEGDFILGLDIFATERVSISPSFNYYFSNEQKTGGYTSSGNILQVKLKNRYRKDRTLFITGNTESVSTYDSPYLSKVSAQIGQTHLADTTRLTYRYKFQSTSEEAVSANYLAGTAHYILASYSIYAGDWETRLGLSYTTKNLNDTATTISSYSSFRPGLVFSYKNSDNGKFDIKFSLNIKNYKKKETGEKEKRKDSFFNVTLEKSTKLGKYISLFGSYSYSKNTSNYNTATNNNEYDVNSLKVGVNVDF
ncbi:MAG: hypothetical protein HN576_06755 [Bacteriovoracaceae bacterium]|nr:hypothetical protein [Bacteriovoracaceae bacterium]